MHRLRLRSRKPGVDPPDQGFHRAPGSWHPDTVDLAAIAANARELALKFTHEDQHWPLAPLSCRPVAAEAGRSGAT